MTAARPAPRRKKKRNKAAPKPSEHVHLRGARPRDRLLIGWREWVLLADWPEPIKAKIDTGARTSALHAVDVRRVRRGSKRLVRFVVFPHQRSAEGAFEVVAPFAGNRMIRSSNGQEEVRPVVEIDVHLGGISWPIELTLTRRDVMGFRMLLGRSAVRGHTVIDPGRSFLTSPLP